MSLVALDGTPLVIAGAACRPDFGLSTLAAAQNAIAAANAAVEFIGYIFTEDGASHTLDTAGSSSIGWRSGAVTFASGSTTVKVGFGTVDTGNGPAARATNSTGTVTYSVSKSLTGGGGGITANAWQEHVPDSGSLAIANGDLVALSIQMTARGGADTVQITSGTIAAVSILPTVTAFDGTSTYTGQAAAPNAVITFNDGKLGFFFGSAPFSTPATTQTWNSGSATKEYGNYFKMPFPAKIYGFFAPVNFSADCSLVLYETPLGTPSAAKTIAVDANAIGNANTGRMGHFLLPAPYTYIANTDIALSMKPGASNVSAVYATFNASAHQKGYAFGTNGYAVNRVAGSFSAQNSNKDRFNLGLLLGAFDSGPFGQFVSCQRGTPF